jgi:dTDP-4-amino-4,6-dideoxygalactose transaminase
MIPLVDLKAQYAAIRADVDAAMQRVLDDANFIMGAQVRSFEGNFAAFCGAAQCVGISSGTSALELALRACNVGNGDEVITVAHTFIATAEAISAAGATPVFVDIDASTGLMDPALLARAITPRTRAVMPVHLYGQPCDMDAILATARAHNLAVIEDAAQAHGARWNGARVGALGDVACFSFYPGKNLGAYGDAGAVVTDKPEIAQRVRLLRNHGRTQKYVHEIVGFGERLDTLQAAVLDAKLPFLEGWTRARQRLAARYTAAFTASGATSGSHPALVLPAVDPRAESVWHLYVVQVENRDALVEYLHARGIEAGVHYPLPLHMQPAYAHLGIAQGALPATERFAGRCVSLPLYPEMSDAQQDEVIAQVLAFLDGAA